MITKNPFTQITEKEKKELTLNLPQEELEPSYMTIFMQAHFKTQEIIRSMQTPDDTNFLTMVEYMISLILDDEQMMKVRGRYITMYDEAIADRAKKLGVEPAQLDNTVRSELRLSVCMVILHEVNMFLDTFLGLRKKLVIGEV